MNGKRSRRLISFFFFCIMGSLFFSLLAFAQQKAGPEERGQEASATQAQATMASLFGRGASMPGIPRINGTIALPSFDSSGMTIDEGALRAAERGDPSEGNG
ncbi:MAG: hypothetical protein WCJ71_08410 [Candidatus Omnitrophota bacterium]